MDHRAGIIYVASGLKYFDEAVNSIIRSLRYIDKFPIYIYTDDIYNHRPLPPNVRLRYLGNPLFSYGDKIPPLIRPPFDLNLYLDTDTAVVSPIHLLFDLLIPFDVCAALAPVRHPSGWSSSKPPKLFPELNTGVLLFRRSSLIQRFFSDWQSLFNKLYLEFDQTWDQASFREILWQYISRHHLRFYSLPPECNLRLTKPWIVGKGLQATILHGRINDTDFEKLSSYLNNDISFFRSWEDWKKLYPETKLKLKTTPNPRISSN